MKINIESIIKAIFKPTISEEKVNKEELKLGVKEELEHTKNKRIAKVIALHHLEEDPKYYTKLKSLFDEDSK